MKTGAIMRLLIFIYFLMSVAMLSFAGVGGWLQGGTEDLRQGRFELYTGRDGDIWWRLKSPNGQVIASGEGYRDRASARKGIAAIRRYAHDAKLEEIEVK